MAETFRRAKLLPIERRHVLTGQDQGYRSVLRFNRDAPRYGGLVGVAGTDDNQPGNRSKTGDLLHGLMGRTVLTHSDAVVRENIDHLHPHQRGEPDRRAHVVREGQKRRAERDGAAVRGQAVQDRAHPVFPNPKLQVAARVAPAAACGTLQVADGHFRVLKVARIFQFGDAWRGSDRPNPR